MIYLILNILSVLIMSVSLALYKIYGKRQSTQCRKCFKYDILTSDGYCKPCNREQKIDSVTTNKLNIKFVINSTLLNFLYWSFIILAILLELIGLVFRIPILTKYQTITLLISTLIYLGNLVQDLKIK